MALDLNWIELDKTSYLLGVLAIIEVDLYLNWIELDKTSCLPGVLAESSYCRSGS